MAQRSIVTGGAGFIGSHIVDALVERGDDVHVIDDLSAGSRENVNRNAVLHEQDIGELDAVQNVLEGADCVFHLAALPRVSFSLEYPAKTHDTNVTGTFNVLEAAYRSGVSRVVFASSSSVYGDQDMMPLEESMQPNPKSPYALHKRIGELYARMYANVFGLSTVCLRFFNIYGRRQDPNGPYALVTVKFMRQKAAGEPLTITGDGEQTRDFTHVSDVVRANLAAAESEQVGSGEVMNIGAGNNISINRLAELVGGEKTYTEARLEPRDTLADSQRAKALLGWEPQVSIEDGIADMKEEWGG